MREQRHERVVPPELGDEPLYKEEGPRQPRMSMARRMWIAWCLGWAAFWAGAGVYTIGITWLLVPVSLAAILLPVAKDASEG